MTRFNDYADIPQVFRTGRPPSVTEQDRRDLIRGLMWGLFIGGPAIGVLLAWIVTRAG